MTCSASPARLLAGSKKTQQGRAPTVKKLRDPGAWPSSHAFPDMQCEDRGAVFGRGTDKNDNWDQTRKLQKKGEE